MRSAQKPAYSQRRQSGRVGLRLNLSVGGIRRSLSSVWAVSSCAGSLVHHPLGFGVARNTTGAFLNLTAQISDASLYSIFVHGHYFGSGGNPRPSAAFGPWDLAG